MRRLALLLAALAASFPLALRAQGTDIDEGTDVRARISAELDRKIIKGFHVYGGAEGRFKDNVGRVNDFRLMAGTTYKFSDWFKAGAGYTFIGNLDGSGVLEPRHRVHLDGTLSFRTGFWRFSLRERLQLTHRSEDINVYQQTRNALAVKSRVKVSWKGSRTLEPYAFFEVRNTLNDPSFTATYNTGTLTYSNVSFNGYKDAYINRYRAAAGLDWHISKRHSIEFYGYFDRYRDKDIDTNRQGSESWETNGLVLKSLTYRTGTNLTFGAAYRFSF